MVISDDLTFLLILLLLGGVGFCLAIVGLLYIQLLYTYEDSDGPVFATILWVGAAALTLKFPPTIPIMLVTAGVLAILHGIVAAVVVGVRDAVSALRNR